MLDKIKEWFRSLDDLDKVIFWIVFILIFISVCSVGLYFYVFWGAISENQSHWGLFGDYAGGFIGMIISLIAVLLIFITYRLQQKELNPTNKALKAQNTQLRLQQFQNVIFKLLERKDLLLNNIKNRREEGIHALRGFVSQFETQINRHKIKREVALQNFWKNNKGNLTAFLNTYVSTIDFFNSFDIENREQEKIKDQLVQLYSSNLSITEKKILKLIFEYFETHKPEIEKVTRCHNLSIEYQILDSGKGYW